MSIDAAFKYDVFVSHAKVDRYWVESNLIPKLQQAQLKMILSFKDFVPGAPKIAEIERAIKESRKTLVVITQAYIADEWTEFEKQVLTSLDPGSRERRIIPLLVSDCNLTLFKYLVSIDLTDSSIEESEWSRLINHLKQQAANSSYVSTPPRDLDTILESFTDPFIKEIERKLRDMETPHWIAAGFEIPQENFNFTAVYFSNQIDKLRQYQFQINDLCQQLQTGNINVSDQAFVVEFKEFLSHIIERCSQIDEIISVGTEFDQKLNIQKQIERINSKAESLRSFVTQSAFEGMQNPRRLPQINGQVRVAAYEIGIALRGLIPYLGKIYSLADKTIV